MKKYIFGIAMLGIALQSFGTLTEDPKVTTNTNHKAKTAVFKKADKGKDIYSKTCIACHQANGQGIPGAFPPLAKSDYLNKDVNRAIKGVVKGLTGAITVNGQKFNNTMPAQALSDQEIADALTYVYSNWGNNKTVVTAAMVKAQRK